MNLSIWHIITSILESILKNIVKNKVVLHEWKKADSIVCTKEQLVSAANAKEKYFVIIILNSLKFQPSPNKPETSVQEDWSWRWHYKRQY